MVSMIKYLNEITADEPGVKQRMASNFDKHLTKAVQTAGKNDNAFDKHENLSIRFLRQSRNKPAFKPSLP